MSVRVLVVEDEAIVAEDLRVSLETLGYEVCAVVDSGQAALDETESLTPDLVLMDIVLAGEMSGTEAGGHIRTRFHIPVVYLTAYTDDETLRQAGISDPAGYITKPFDDKELKSVIEIALHKARLDAERRRAEEALRESEQQFRQMAHSIRKVFWLFDWIERKAIYVSPAYEEIWGRSVKEVYARYENWWAYVHPDDRAYARESFGGIAETGGGEIREYRIVRPDGSIHWISDEGFAVYDEQGNVCRIAGIAEESTARKLAEESLHNARVELEHRVEVRTARLAAANDRLKSQIEERRRAEEALRQSEQKYRSLLETANEQLKFERLISDISSWFIGLPRNQVDSRIRNALGRVSKLFGVDGAGFGQFVTEDSLLQATHGWLPNIWDAEWITAAAERARFPNLIPHLMREGEIIWGRIEDHPDWPEELEFVKGAGFGAGVQVAIGIEDESLYWIGAVSASEKAWPDDVVQRLRLVGEIFANAVKRRRAEEKIEAEQELLRELLELQERERRIIVQEIHDGFLQGVAGALMRLQAESEKLKSQKDVSLDQLESVAGLLRKTIADGRRMIADLRPEVIDHEGLLEAIKHLVAAENDQGDLYVAYKHDVQFKRLDPMLEGAMYRIIQESLNNVKHHAQTNHASVQIAQHGGRVRIEVRDQGIGFDESRAPADRFGLRGIRERARLFGGRAVIESMPGAGTKVVAEFPIAPDHGREESKADE